MSKCTTVIEDNDATLTEVALALKEKLQKYDSIFCGEVAKLV